MNTISQEKASTTIVRTAVATVESVLRMPHLASMAVAPAKTAEPKANMIHILPIPRLCSAVNITVKMVLHFPSRVNTARGPETSFYGLTPNGKWL